MMVIKSSIRGSGVYSDVFKIGNID